MSEENKTDNSQVLENDHRVLNFLGAALSVVAITLPMFGQKFFLPVFLIALAVFLAVAALVTFWKGKFGTRFDWAFIALISSLLMGIVSFADLVRDLRNAPPYSNQYQEAQNGLYILPLIVFGACLAISLIVMGAVRLVGKLLMKNN